MSAKRDVKLATAGGSGGGGGGVIYIAAGSIVAGAGLGFTIEVSGGAGGAGVANYGIVNWSERWCPTAIITSIMRSSASSKTRMACGLPSRTGGRSREICWSEPMVFVRPCASSSFQQSRPSMQAIRYGVVWQRRPRCVQTSETWCSNGLRFTSRRVPRLCSSDSRRGQRPSRWQAPLQLGLGPKDQRSRARGHADRRQRLPPSHGHRTHTHSR